MTRLAAVPEPLLRDGIYVRVSAVMGRADDRFLSPDIQREAIDRARGRGPASTVVDEWRDIDVSTARVKAANRPGLQAALTAARAGRIDRLWVLTLDRFDRDTSALKTFDEVAALGVELWTEAGRLDVDTPEGYLSVSMQLAIARYQRDRIGKAWRQTHEHRLERGQPHTPGRGKFGYRYDRDARTYVPDPVTGPLLAEAYRRFVDGHSFRTVAAWLNDIGSTTIDGGGWSVDTVRRVLDSGFAAGRITYGTTAAVGSHEFLIDDDLWAAFQARRKQRAVATNIERSTYPLSGLLRCGQCGAPMVIAIKSAEGIPIYRCRAARDRAAHDGGFVSSRHVEREVLKWVADIAADVEETINLSAKMRRRDSRNGDELTAAKRRVDELERQLQALVRHLASGRLTESEFDTAAASLRVDGDQARARVATLQAAAGEPRSIDPPKLAARLVADWELLPVESRREALRRLLDRVEVRCGKPHATVTCFPVWE